MNIKPYICEMQVSWLVKRSLQIHRNKKLYATLLALLMLIEVFSIVIVLSSPTDSITLTSTGKISDDIYAKSGLAADIQSAVNTAASAGGGTVIVPAGNWTWNGGSVTIPPGVNVIGTGLAGCYNHTTGWAPYTPQTILNDTLRQQVGTASSTMFSVNPGSHDVNNPVTTSVRISGIEFVASPPLNYTDENGYADSAIVINQIYNWRVDHCTFINFAGISVLGEAWSGVNVSATCYGECDHDICTLPYKLTRTNDGSSWAWGYGFYAIGMYPGTPGYGTWDTHAQDFFGYYGPKLGYSIMYVEDSVLDYCRHSIDAMGGGFYCARFDLFENSSCAYEAGLCDMHGAGYNAGRGCEIYNCTFRAISGPFANGNPVAYPWIDGDTNGLLLRGGSCLFYNNTMYGNGLTGEGAAMEHLTTLDYNCSIVAYELINQTYIWGNTMYNGNQGFFDNTSIYVPSLGKSYSIVQNVNYFLRAPTQAKDGFTYTPYPYPILSGGT
jgi:hypothetical protein